MERQQLQAKRIRPRGGQRAYRIIQDLVTFKVLSQDTDGAYTLFETRTPPGGGTPPHIQYREEEAFFILEGVYTFQLGDQTMELEPGEFVLVPRGLPHMFTNKGSVPARMLVMNSPGGIHEQFFAEIGEPIADLSAPLPLSGPPDVAKIVAVGQKYGIEILPSPGVE
jgi:mannose-6-phosphate isomerase-like protein (cupin superfamily)